MSQVFIEKTVWRGVEIPHAEFQQLVESAGLNDIQKSGLPLPFAPLRKAARNSGLVVRMPSAEIAGRIRTIVDDVSAAAVTRFSQITRQRNVKPLVVALDAVLDRETRELPNGDALRWADLPVVNLLQIYPEKMRSTLRVASWDDHPNAQGHRLIAERLYPALTDFLEEEFAGE